jgi:hypothetical protein
MAQMKKSGAAKPAYKAGARSKSGASTAAAVGKRFGITAREARDIATALGTLGKSAQLDAKANSRRGGKNTLYFTKPSLGNLAKQVGETARAAATGKKGTESDQIRKSGSGNVAGFTGSSRANKSISRGVGSVDKIAKNWQKADEKANKVKRKK